MQAVTVIGELITAGGVLVFLLFATWCTTKVVLEFMLVPEMSDEEIECGTQRMGDSRRHEATQQLLGLQSITRN